MCYLLDVFNTLFLKFYENPKISPIFLISYDFFLGKRNQSLRFPNFFNKSFLN